MDVIIEPGTIQGTIKAPASKSLSQRAFAAALLCGRPSLISGVGNSKDELAALEIIKILGAEVRTTSKGFEIHPIGRRKADPIRIYCGESGLSARMFTPVAACMASETEIHGRGSLLLRPMDFFEQVLPQLGFNVQSQRGRLPLKINGEFRVTSLEIDGSSSSQYLSGLLFAFSAANARGKHIRVRNLNSKPYTQLTLDVLRDFDMLCPEWEAGDCFSFGEGDAAPGKSKIEYQVAGDWSGAAFLLVGAVVGGKLEVNGLNPDSRQGDKAILEVLLDQGAALSWKDRTLIISKGADQVAERKAFSFDATHCPDLFPPLTALAAFCEGVSEIKGARRLIHKESNRADTLSSEFGKLGVDVTISDDVIRVQGGKVLGGEVSAHGDHRIAMACAIAGLGARDPIRINGAEAVEKSYPDFFKDLQTLGVRIKYIQ